MITPGSARLTIGHQDSHGASSLHGPAGDQGRRVGRAAADSTPEHEQGDDGKRGPTAAKHVGQLAQQRLKGGAGQEEGVGKPDPIVAQRDLLEDNGRRRREHRVLERREPHHDAQAHNDDPEAEALLLLYAWIRFGPSHVCYCCCYCCCVCRGRAGARYVDVLFISSYTMSSNFNNKEYTKYFLNSFIIY